MAFDVSRALQMGFAFASLRNRLFNAMASAACGSRIRVDWRNLKIAHPGGIRIGRNFSAGHSLWLESVAGQGRLIIGDDVNVSDSVHIGCASKVQIGDGVLIGSRVLIIDHAHGKTDEIVGELAPDARPIYSKGPVVIGRAVWIGDGACVLAGVTVGDRAIVGANAVVLRDIPASTVWAGVPARQVWPVPAAAP